MQGDAARQGLAAIWRGVVRDVSGLNVKVGHGWGDTLILTCWCLDMFRTQEQRAAETEEMRAVETVQISAVEARAMTSHATCAMTQLAASRMNCQPLA